MAKPPDPLPTANVAGFVADLAREHGVVVVRTKLDQFAEKLTELSGDDVRLDATELALVKLTERGVITPREMNMLILNHIREQRRSGLS
ncbi:MAG: hypothetical protein GTN84_15835 [Hydrogenophaga sp.]|uniref:hypothetical protein n=1 Tax=Hydrogenophaga sp. TaxID=1904254 RepID=UPI0016B883DA|nr:hypothetical protein [Hydrogenophaga sp.]NIM42848.1 hypothetical protein [Hydrogenophaga sp.]NIN27781.1 hypothetical protein [Hydrogenophaga sp.]NIN32600.1 hypothetical protein [Hydrogenophaga sp.]NIN57054.1 hypothetical protein [Hydrogenophaga sp.]NIO53465.1 hypothetical protein [Hydrogenophaga sp.]